jgi:hypothetical protein
MAYGDDDMKPKPKGEAISETTLSTIIAQQIELAKHHDKHEREATRDKAIDYYFGNMDKYVPPEPNRSRVVSRDVADTIGWTLPQLMRAFLSSDRVALAEPEGIEDIDFADKATIGLNYVFLKDNDGESTLYDAIWNALLVGNAPIKTYYDDTPVYKTSFHSGLTVEQAALLLQDESTEVLAQEQTEAFADDGMGGQVAVVLYELKIKRKVMDGRFIVEAIPPEEFLIDADAITTENAAFTDHWQQKTRSELVAMGYDKDEVYEIPAAGRADTPEEIARRMYIDNESTDASMERVDYHECFIRIDVDGDGEAELVRACYAGDQNGKLLDWEVWEDEHPFDDIKCEPIPHRWDARSQADETIDIQDIKTVLQRQLLNNTYWVNNPQQAVIGDVKNPESLTDPQFGQPVMMKSGGSVVALERPYIGDKALIALTHFDEVRQSRTGVGRQTMALDPETLQNQTATASNNNKDAQYTQVEQYARNMAAGLRKVFRKLLKLMVKHQEYSRKVMNKGKEVEIDPRFWNADMDITINTGLGTGSRDRDLAMLGNVMSSQLMLADRFVSLGAMEDAIDMLPKILMTMEKMAEAAGIRNPDDFYPEYTEEKVAQLKQMAAERAQQPPPEVALEQMKQQGAQQLKAVDAQISMQQAETKAQGDIVKNKAELEADMMTAEAERQNALILAQQKMEHDFRLQQEQIASNERIKAAELKQQRELELLKLNMTDVQAGEDGEPKPVDATTAMLMDGLGRLGEGVSRLGEMFAGMQAMMNAPTEIVRGPDGKAMGTRKVVN